MLKASDDPLLLSGSSRPSPDRLLRFSEELVHSAVKLIKRQVTGRRPVVLPEIFPDNGNQPDRTGDDCRSLDGFAFIA